jgi:uncharacterized protein (TIGR03000 family)
MTPAPGGETAPSPSTPSAPAAPAAPKGGNTKVDPADKNKAKVVVELPTDAKLYIDDQLTNSTSDRRVFSTPVLEKGQTYYYDVRAEMVRNGRTVTETKRVIVKAGAEASTTFFGVGNTTPASAVVSR